MKILDLMNTNPNWMEVIQSAPYNVTIKNDGEYYLLKYNQLSSDFNEEIVRECRGSIFRLDGAEWICVCHPFDKFGNYGESYVPNIDWENAYVYEKVDGSLMKMWYDRNQWHLSTNGTINAYKAEMDAWGKTFGEYFEYALMDAYDLDIEHMSYVMNEEWTYMFELVGPQNRLVVEYEKPCVFFLGGRNNRTHQEHIPNDCALEEFLWIPRMYNLTSLEECIEVAAAMSSNEEGFVVCDADFNRIKIKSPEYLMAFHMVNNGVITPRRIINMLMNDQIDDFLAYCPQHKGEVYKIIDGIKEYKNALEEEKIKASVYFDLDKRDFWTSIDYLTHKHFLTICYKDNTLTAEEYIKNQLEHIGVGWLLKIIC